MNIADVWPVHYALEADPGRRTASFPIYRTEDEARAVAEGIENKARLDGRLHAPVRILRRVIGPWEPVAEPAEADLFDLLEDDQLTAVRTLLNTLADDLHKATDAQFSRGLMILRVKQLRAALGGDR